MCDDVYVADGAPACRSALRVASSVSMRSFSIRRRLSLAIKMVAALLLIICCCQAAAATAHEERAASFLGMEADADPPCTTTTDAVVHAARRVCGNVPVDGRSSPSACRRDRRLPGGRSLASGCARPPTCGCSAAGRKRRGSWASLRRRGCFSGTGRRSDCWSATGPTDRPALGQR